MADEAFGRSASAPLPVGCFNLCRRADLHDMPEMPILIGAAHQKELKARI
jgi:hypothetical protein